MPIYEYACQACGHRLETMQRLSDAPLTDCPECGASALRKLVSAAAFQLKGTGWYVTDFRDSGKGKEKTGGDAAADSSKDTSSGDKVKTGEKSTASGGSDGAKAKEATSKTSDSSTAAK